MEHGAWREKNESKIYIISSWIDYVVPHAPCPILSIPRAFAADDQTPAVSQAKADYQEFLKQLKQLNQQYQQITGEIKKTLKQEGVPEIDEQTGELTVRPFVDDPEKTELGRVIRQTDQDMTVAMEMPGLKKDSISVRIQDSQFLHVSADKKDGLFAVKHVKKVVRLPAPADENGAEAKYEDGILTVKILKAAKKEIPVPVS